MDKRRSLTPDSGTPPPNSPLHAMRRGGARQTVSDRVTFRPQEGTSIEGWALNVSRGGVRAILDGDASEGCKVELGQEFEIFVGDTASTPGRKGRIVWLQEEPDGFVVGVEYLGADASGSQQAIAALTVPNDPKTERLEPRTERLEPKTERIEPKTEPLGSLDLRPKTAPPDENPKG